VETLVEMMANKVISEERAQVVQVVPTLLLVPEEMAVMDPQELSAFLRKAIYNREPEEVVEEVVQLGILETVLLMQMVIQET